VATLFFFCRLRHRAKSVSNSRARRSLDTRQWIACKIS
jgi:hypothetical protein